MKPTLSALRACLSALTRFFDARSEGETAFLDIATLTVMIDRTLDDDTARSKIFGRAVPPPDGLFEWRARRDFVRALPAGAVKTRLGRTLGGPKTRRRFVVALNTGTPQLLETFKRHRRRLLRGYAARVVRGFAAERWL